MPSKEFLLDSGINITIFKSRASRNLRLSVGPSGRVRVSIPNWAPYRTGLDFAKSRENWIVSQQKTPVLLQHGQAIGKAHHLEFVAKPGLTKVASRIKLSTVTVTYSAQATPMANEVQKEAEKACIRALRLQAESLLPQRLAKLAQTHGYQYESVSIKRLKSRWGSCDQQKHIVLNLFLMQLPWELIDYVLLHELTHTEILRHGPDFWGTMEAKLPNAQALKKAVHQYHPVIAAG